MLLLRHQLRVVRPSGQEATPNRGGSDDHGRAEPESEPCNATLVGMLVQPETVLGWRRELVRRRWAAFRRRRGPRRPCLDPELQKLILQMAKDNPIWGCVRVRGELLKLGHRVSATANSHVAAPRPDRPAPLRSRHTWKTFLRTQALAIVFTDFLSVDTVLPNGFTSLYIYVCSWRLSG